MNSISEILKQKDELVIDPKWKRIGFTALGNKIIVNPKISLPAKGLYWYLMVRCFQKDSCFPGNGLMNKDLNVGITSIIKYKKELVEKGLLKVKRRGWGKPNKYTLKF